jgi:hypothetical protein
MYSIQAATCPLFYDIFHILEHILSIVTTIIVINQMNNLHPPHICAIYIHFVVLNNIF